RISEEFEVRPEIISLVVSGKLLKTSSGKLRRRAIAAALQSDELSSAFQWRAPSGEKLVVTSVEAGESGLSNEVESLKTWLNDYAGKRLNMRLADERRSVPPNVILDFGRKGLFGLEVPRASGGLGLSMTEVVSVLSHLAGIDTTLASLVGIHNAL